MPNTVIIGSGSYIPEVVIKGSHFMDSTFFTDEGELIDKPNAEIIEKFVEITEIEERRYVKDDEFNSDLAYRASEVAIQDLSLIHI